MLVDAVETPRGVSLSAHDADLGVLLDVLHIGVALESGELALV